MAVDREVRIRITGDASDFKEKAEAVKREVEELAKDIKAGKLTLAEALGLPKKQAGIAVGKTFPITKKYLEAKKTLREYYEEQPAVAGKKPIALPGKQISYLSELKRLKALEKLREYYEGKPAVAGKKPIPLPGATVSGFQKFSMKFREFSLKTAPKLAKTARQISFMGFVLGYTSGRIVRIFTDIGRSFLNFIRQITGFDDAISFLEDTLTKLAIGGKISAVNVDEMVSSWKEWLNETMRFQGILGQVQALLIPIFAKALKPVNDVLEVWVRQLSETLKANPQIIENVGKATEAFMKAIEPMITAFIKELPSLSEQLPQIAASFGAILSGIIDGFKEIVKTMAWIASLPFGKEFLYNAGKIMAILMAIGPVISLLFSIISILIQAFGGIEKLFTWIIGLKGVTAGLEVAGLTAGGGGLTASITAALTGAKEAITAGITSSGTALAGTFAAVAGPALAAYIIDAATEAIYPGARAERFARGPVELGTAQQITIYNTLNVDNVSSAVQISDLYDEMNKYDANKLFIEMQRRGLR